MTPEALRLTLKAFLASHLRIDEWGVNFPEQESYPDQPSSIAREEPMTKGMVLESGSFTFPPALFRLDLSYLIMFRFESAYTYHQIPKSQAEGIMVKMIQLLVDEPTCLHLDIDEIDATGEVTVAETASKDWLLVYKFNLSPRFEIHPEEYDIPSPLMRPAEGGVELIPEEYQGEIVSPAVAGMTMYGFRMVAVVEDRLVYADHSNPETAYSVLGILLAGVPEGFPGRVQTDGPVSNSGWAWIPNRPIYLGVNGVLTQEAPSSGFLLAVATPITDDRIQLEIHRPQFYPGVL